MPTTKQIDANRATSDFNQVLGGRYVNGKLLHETAHGNWLSSEASTTTQRYNLHFNNSSLATSNAATRYVGYYIRCVSEEKTVLDLTYMQDIHFSRCRDYYYD